MKRIYNIILATACLALASCANELEDNKASNALLRKPMTFVSSLEGTSTKTALVQDGDVFRIQWNPEDTIKVFSAEDAAGAEFAINDEMSSVDMMSVTFTGSIAGSAPFAAIYPAYEGATYDATNNSVSFALPQTQEYAPSTFANGANPEVAYVEEGNVLKFKNLCGVLRLSLKGDVTISRIDLYDNDATANLWGTATANVESLATTVDNDDADRNHVSINCDGTIELSDEYATTIHFVLPVGSLSSGFSVVFTTPEGATCTINTSKSNTISRGVVRSMPELNVTSDKLVLPYIDLDSNEHANCYIISETGKYRFQAVEGNTENIISEAVSADVLWESFGTDTAPSVGDVIPTVELEDGFVKFETPSELKNGNAVVAVRDNGGNILWSWHIWVCKGYDPIANAKVYANNAGTMMDRNLGATVATPGYVKAFGLLYQWGRKDPFMSQATSELGCSTKAASTIAWPSAVVSDATVGTIEYATKNPTTLILRNDGESYDWEMTDGNTNDVSRWFDGDNKTKYDPCPAGWHVANGGNHGVWATAFGTSGFVNASSYMDNTHNGFMIPANVAGSEDWIPCAASTASSSDSFYEQTLRWYYHTRTPMEANGDDRGNYTFYLTHDGTINPTHPYDHCASSRPVRCQKEGTGYSMVENEAVDLSAAGTANCYIVTEAGSYKFPTVKGNSSTSVGTVASAEVLWSSYGTDMAVLKGDIVSTAVYKDGYITFTTHGKDGNGVIAAKDESGNILWSWHIWVCEGFDPEATECVYANNAGTLMDRNLGATSVTPGDAKALGLLYQWGRKDPFPAARSASADCEDPAVTYPATLPDPVLTSATIGTIDYAIKNPTTMIIISSTSTNKDWQYSTGTTNNVSRWYDGDTKTIYDPCPSGWHVANGGADGVLATAFGATTSQDMSSYYSSSQFGFTLPESMSGKKTWYPFVYPRPSATGLVTIGLFSYVQSRTPYDATGNDFGSYCFRMNKTDGSIYPTLAKSYAAGAISVRCQKEGTGNGAAPIVHVTGVTLNKTYADITAGSSVTLTATIAPTNSTSKKVTWTSSNTAVATVSSTGVVKGVAAGNCTITATCDGKSATCKIGVGANDFWTYILTKYDTSKDGVMSSTEIAAVTSLDISAKTFTSLSGIEKLTALKYLNVSGVPITSLNITKNTNLVWVYANKCTSLATITVASIKTFPSILVNRSTKIVHDGSSSWTLSCSTPYVLISTATTTAIAINLTETTGAYTTSGIPSKAQAQLMINKYSTFKDMLSKAGYSAVGTTSYLTGTYSGRGNDSSGEYEVNKYYTYKLTGTFSTTIGYYLPPSTKGYIKSKLIKITTFQ